MLLKPYSLISILVVLFCINQVSANKSLKFSKANIYFYSDTTYKIIPSIAGTFGYEILIKGKTLIRQKNIPGLAGSMGFKRKEDAEKAAKLVINKLNAGIMPPSIDRHELDSMKIKYQQP